MMIDVLGYTYYRIARVLKGLKPWANKLYDVYAPAYIAACILSNLTVLCVLFLRIKYHLSDIKSSQVFSISLFLWAFPYGLFIVSGDQIQMANYTIN